MTQTVLDFNFHPAFKTKIVKFCSKYHDKKALERLMRLIEAHFEPSVPFVFSDKILRRIEGTGQLVYKVNMVVTGLKPGQFPRVCFWKRQNQIYFLSFGTHLENYKDANLRREIIQRLKEVSSEVH